MKFELKDKAIQYIDNSGKIHRRRWIELCGVFESPYCRITSKTYKTWSDYSFKAQIYDFQFQKMKKPQPELHLVIQLQFSHLKKINEKEILRRIGSGEGDVYFNDVPNDNATILREGNIELTCNDMKNRELFLRRLLREKELGYY